MDFYDPLLRPHILDFFNSVQDPEEIVRRIKDDPGYGSAQGYGIRMSLARRILAVRDQLPEGKFTSVAQIDRISGVGPDTCHDIAFTFAQFGAGSNSVYRSLAQDVTVSARKDLLVATIHVSSGAYLFVESDGRYGPASPGAMANMFIKVDGKKVSNDSLIDWRASTNPQQHSFNVIGATYLQPGHHTVALVAEPPAGSFYVGARTNLCVMTKPATYVDWKTLQPDTEAYTFDTDVDRGIPIPHTPFLSHTFSSSGEDIVVLGSGRSYHSGIIGDPNTSGDAMWGIYLDGEHLGNAASMWAMNDLWTGAETQAPMFNHAFFHVPAGRHTVSLDASACPWYGLKKINRVCYSVGAGTKLLTLRGGMSVKGSAPISQAHHNSLEYLNIGDGTWGGFKVAQADIQIPSGHNGVVMFIAKSRVQGGRYDQGGTVSLWIEIDGVRVGSTGVQQLAKPDCVSHRSICASYLAAEQNALSVGDHHIEVFAKAKGSFKHLALVEDLPLIWFD